MSTAYCQSCATERAFEYDPSSGGTYCSACGNVAEESGIVSEITFGESASGAAVVTGSYVGLDQTRAKLSSGRRPAGASGIESREQTIANGRRKIQQSIHSMKLPDRFVDVAQRWYTLALNSNFVRGRRTDYIIAACLYIVCRTEGTSHQLIDFSDELRVNVFVLGSTYLKLVRSLNMSIPTIDPSLYISRFASMLEFGEETQQVANDAIRLVQRFSRDWIDMGRRPAGVCGAALILAARMNNFRRSVEEVVQVVRIADTTLKKRLEEFGMTPSSQLTVTDFRAVTLNEEQDPPAYTAGLRKERNLRDETEGPPKKKRKVRFESDIESGDEDDDNANNTINGTGDHELDVSGQARFDDMFAEMDRLVNGDVPVPSPTSSMLDPPIFPLAEEAEEVDVAPDEQDEEELLDNFAEQEGAMPEDAPRKRGRKRRASSAGSEGPSTRPNVDPRTGQKLPPPDTRTAEERAAEEAETAALTNEIVDELQANPNFNILEQETSASQDKAIDKARAGRILPRPRIASPTTDDAAITAAFNSLTDPASASLPPTPLPLHPDLQIGQKGPIVFDEESNAAQALRANNTAAETAEEAPDLLDDLDEDELDDLILTEEEVRIKERLWMEFNKDYLANVAEKHLRAELDEKPLRKRLRKKPVKPRDSSEPTAETAADATKQLLKQKKFSKKINYAAIDNLLGFDGDADAGATGTNAVGSLFEEEGADGERNNPWDASSQRSRASSVVSSIGGSSTLGRKPSKKRKSALAEAKKMHAELSNEPTPQKPAPKRQQRKVSTTSKTSKTLKPNHPSSPKKQSRSLPAKAAKGPLAVPEDTVAPAVAHDEEEDDATTRPPANDEEEFAQMKARALGGDNEEEGYDEF